MSKHIGMYKTSLGEKPGDEPAIIGIGIEATWGLAWPNVIARVWYEESKGQKSEWYYDLFSGDRSKVIKALKAEGFIIDADKSTDDYDKWVNLNIAIKRREDGVKLVKPDNTEIKVVDISSDPEGKYKYAQNSGYEKRNGWSDVKRLEHTLILTIPPKPDNPEGFAVAISDYQASGKVYPFTFFIC